ncbi:MAG: prolyl oligopeptidase family serine peptidase [bacterium]
MFRFSVALALAASIPFALAVAARADEMNDPYLDLEDVTGETALSWVREQNAACTSALAQTDEFRALEARLLAIMDSDQRIPYVSKRGAYYYNFWRDAANPRGLWRRTSLEEYKKPEPRWEIIIDLDKLSAAENENWVWEHAEYLAPAYERCLIVLSRGGADAAVIREFDLTAKQFVADGFTLSEAKSSVAWHDRDHIFVGTDFGPGSLTSSGYPRVAKLWRRGTPLSEAVTVMEGEETDVSVYAWRDLTPGFERDFVRRGTTFWSNEMFLRRGGELIHIDKPSDAITSIHRDLIFLELRSDWNLGDVTYPAGALVATDFEAFLGGARTMDVIFQPTARKSLASFSPTLNHLILNELDNVRNRLYVLTREGTAWRREPLPGMPQFGTVSAFAVDADSSDDYFVTASDYLTPSSLRMGTIGEGPASVLRQLPAFFEAAGLVVNQHEAISADGTRIPYFEVSREKLALDGSAPTVIYGYGGFEVPTLPGYQASTGAGWLERGGVYVAANIRGGGEFGPSWHQAALKENRPRAYEDFIAIGEDLVRRKVTSPEHLGAIGGSNGGLLVGNILTMRPDLFGAIVCQAPLLDMRRYHKLLAGASWMAEYGDPDQPEEWEFIRTFSPYHNVKAAAKYPPTLFTTSTRDDRVHPGHARKMFALMKSMGHDVLYYENIEGGHAGAADNKQAAFKSALAYTFLWNELSGD